MRGNPYKKYRREPQLKIGSKAENILYSEKNINPDLNFFNKQLSEEEYLSNKRKIYQKEEFSTLSKNFQDNYMGPPNLAHQRIDVDNVSGKIGQERREMEISKYQSQPSFAKDQVYNTYINNDRERNNKKYYHNIINNTIFGFCDPGMKYPKTSYQSNFRGNDINEQLKYLSKRQYEDYLQFRKEQIELMNKGNLGKNLRELPPRKRKEEMNFEEIRNNMGERELRDKRIKDEADNLMKEQRILDQNQVRTLNPNGYIPSPEEYDNYLKQKREQERNELNNNNNKNINIPQPESYPKEINNNININRRTPYNNQNENMEMNMNREMVNNIENNIENNPNLDKKYYYPEPSQNYPPNINQEKQEEFYQREQMRKTPIKEELPPQNINNNQYNNEEIYNNPQMPKYTPKNIKEEYNYGNEVPHSYEEYQRLMQKEAERENLLRQRQLEQENINNMNNKLNNIQLTKSEEEEFKQYQKEKQNIPMNNYHEQENNIELNEEQLKLKQREEAEMEYLQNVKKYEDIIQDNPEQRFKLPPPPFGSNNIPMMNKMSMESQMQGAEPGYINKMNQVSENPYSIDKYNLGESNLKQNPILHPVNSYQFDFRRLYNPLTNKNN